jgi:hypothetical protein
MQRWEYRVVSLRAGHYTAALNEYGREGWELISVASDDRDVPAPAPGRTRSIPVPRALGRLEDAAAKLSNLGAADASEAEAATTTLMWVLRRPLDDDSA